MENYHKAVPKFRCLEYTVLSKYSTELHGLV